jgi:acetyl esterase/lipase
MAQSEQESPPAVNPPAPNASQRARRRFGNWAARGLLVLLFLLSFFLSAFPTGRAATRAALLLPALLSANGPGLLQSANEPIRHEQATALSLGGEVVLDVYEPIAAPPPVPGVREGMLVVSGVGDNRQDPQLVNLLESLARAGIVAMNVTTPTLSNYILSPVDGDSAVQAFRALQRWPRVGADRVGIISFSAGGVFAAMAAADPRIRDQVRFVLLFGCYFNVADLLRDFGRRALIVDGQRQPWTPSPVPLQVLANTIGTTLPPDEAATLRGAFFVGAPPLTSEQLAQLSPQTVAAYHLLAGDEPERVEANLAAFTPEMNTLIAELSPSSFVAQIHPPVYLLHDRNDHSIPFTESRNFDAALNHLGHPHEYVEFEIFSHVEVRPDLGLGPLISDGAHLLKVLIQLLQVGG